MTSRTLSLSAALVAVMAIAGISSIAPAAATVGNYGQFSYRGCIESARAEAAEYPAGPQRDVAYQARRKACHQKFFLDRLGLDR